MSKTGQKFFSFASHETAAATYFSFGALHAMFKICIPRKTGRLTVHPESVTCIKTSHCTAVNAVLLWSSDVNSAFWGSFTGGRCGWMARSRDNDLHFCNFSEAELFWWSGGNIVKTAMGHIKILWVVNFERTMISLYLDFGCKGILIG